ncbi:MAG: MBL fold metallo-hydrolase, partial [Fibrobacterota bacterium]
GLSIHVQYGTHSVLFDTAQTSGPLAENSRNLGVSLADIDTVVLSHGHYDHGGNLHDMSRDAACFFHRDALKERYSLKDNQPPKYIGLSRADQAALLTWPRSRCHRIVAPAEIAPGLFLTGQIPRTNTFEDTGGPFFCDSAGRQADLLLDDMALFFHTPAGLAVICGCSHAGLVNTLDYIQYLTGERDFALIMGGFHLLHAGRERMEQTTAYLQGLNIHHLMPLHCTGEDVIARLKKTFPEICTGAGAGTEITLPVSQSRDTRRVF